VSDAAADESERVIKLACAVLADFGLTDVGKVTFEVARDVRQPQLAVVCVRGGRGRDFGFGVDLAWSDAEVMAEVATRLQENVSEWESTWGEAIPICPGHMHPMDPRVRGGEASWVCPTEGRTIARIGHVRGAKASPQQTGPSQ
jgi:hypothetical protein